MYFLYNIVKINQVHKKKSIIKIIIIIIIIIIMLKYLFISFLEFCLLPFPFFVHEGLYLALKQNVIEDWVL